MSKVRYYQRVLESDLVDWYSRGWSESFRDRIPSISEDIVTVERGELPGRKDDKNKIRFSLFPLGTLRAVAEVLTEGGRYYGDENWQRVPNARQRYYDAFMRHVDDWWHGATADADSGNHPLAHAIANLFFLLWFDLQLQEK